MNQRCFIVPRAVGDFRPWPTSVGPFARNVAYNEASFCSRPLSTGKDGCGGEAWASNGRQKEGEGAVSGESIVHDG